MCSRRWNSLWLTDPSCQVLQPPQEVNTPPPRFFWGCFLCVFRFAVTAPENGAKKPKQLADVTSARHRAHANLIGGSGGGVVPFTRVRAKYTMQSAPTHVEMQMRSHKFWSFFFFFPHCICCTYTPPKKSFFNFVKSASMLWASCVTLMLNYHHPPPSFPCIYSLN